MEKHYDVAIIGGGPAGSSAAILLAKMGYAVVVFEKEKFPRDHVGESMIPFCYYKMKNMGVLDAIRKFSTGKPGVTFTGRDGKHESTWCFERVIQDEAKLSYHTVRAPFDKALLDHAAACGAHVMEEHLVKEADLSDPAKVNLVVRHKAGDTFPVRARFLIDASGQNTFLARKLNCKSTYKDLDRVALFTHWIKTNYDDGLKAGIIKIIYLGGEKKGWIWVIPVGRNHLSIGISLNNSYVKAFRKKSGDNWVKELYLAETGEAVPLKKILENAVMEHDVQIMGDFSYYSEKKYGANYAMTGDSGAFLDPIFSSGIYVAMETAERVAKAIDIKFREGEEAGSLALQKEFETIEAGYRLIEKFIRLFYDPSLLNFSHIPTNDDGFQKFVSAYEVFHYLLAGDFFAHHEKYNEFIDGLQKEKNFNHFISYVKKQANEYPVSEHCRYDYETIYGHLPEGDTVFPGLSTAKK